jgi:hypothetical protein
MQAQILQTMQQIMANKQNVQPQAPPSLPRDKLGDFQHTKPPTLSHAMEPMNAGDWLKSGEKKLQVVQHNNCEKVLLASHQLSGPTTDWWDAYVEAHDEPESINWPKFRATSMLTMFLRCDQAEKEGVPGFEARILICE